LRKLKAIERLAVDQHERAGTPEDDDKFERLIDAAMSAQLEKDCLNTIIGFLARFGNASRAI
jgi:hypothetical protein